MNNRDRRYFNIAREISLLSDFERARIGAVVVINNRIISTGHNSHKTSPTQYKYNYYRTSNINNFFVPKIHAEIAALAPLIERKDIKWNYVSIYIYRELKNGEIKCARPCEACYKLIRHLGIKTVYYTDENGYFIKEKVI